MSRFAPIETRGEVSDECSRWLWLDTLGNSNCHIDWQKTGEAVVQRWQITVEIEWKFEQELRSCWLDKGDLVYL